eukprot:CAMPEP_0202687298 /NCGR_PEP_ID=MMETSP1385-20130828/2988_1 /ASSEMBLY_ACC=CAM_ASM_000861 /TAXON_ID=933848 /ORGANISM="Elphidium margaritaceum" /LENGTH=1354 /DNA_ID=CAMNT_0049342065 /DNA_START=30 /DNA_END=4091 /DNA_ORIENTATION=-
MADHVIVTEIVDAISEIADDNDTIDFEEFYEMLQQITMDAQEETDGAYDKAALNRYFHRLLNVLQCESNELNIDKYQQYINSNFSSYSKQRQHPALSAFNYMQFLVQCLDKDTHRTHTHNTHMLHPDPTHADDDLPLFSPGHSMHTHAHSYSRSDGVGEQYLKMIELEINEYLESADSMDYADFVECCGEFLGDEYPKHKLRVVYDYMCRQQCANDDQSVSCAEQHDTELRVASFIHTIETLGDGDVDDINDIIRRCFDQVYQTELSKKQTELIAELKKNLKSADKHRNGTVTVEEFMTALKSANVRSISSRDMKKIFAMNTTNGTMKISLFMERFHQLHESTTTTTALPPSTCDDLILHAFDGIVQKKKKKKKNLSKKKRKKKKQDIIRVFSPNEVEKDDDDVDGALDDGIDKIKAAFSQIDENHDHLIDFEEFMAVIVGDLKLNLKQTECKQIYFHQQLTRDYHLDLHEFFAQIYEESLSFPDATAHELLHRYFAKILQEAAPFEKLNQLLLDHALPTQITHSSSSSIAMDMPMDMQLEEKEEKQEEKKEENNLKLSNLQTEIVTLYGSMSSNALLRRVHRQQQFAYTNKYQRVLQQLVSPQVLTSVIRKIRTDSTLKEREIRVMHEEWLICLQRTRNHRFNDLLELDFLLFHLGLIVSQKLLKRFSSTFLNTIEESEELAPPRDLFAAGRSSSEIQRSHDDVLQHLIPSFMKTSKEATNLKLFRSDLKTTLSSLPALQSIGSNTQRTTTSRHDDAEHNESRSYESTKMEFATQIASQMQQVKFKLVDLVGEFLDDKNNTISINEQIEEEDDEESKHSDDDDDDDDDGQADEHNGFEIADADEEKDAVPQLPVRHHAKGKKLNGRSRSLLLLTKTKNATKSILQRRNERVQKQKQKQQQHQLRLTLQSKSARSPDSPASPDGVMFALTGPTSPSMMMVGAADKLGVPLLNRNKLMKSPSSSMNMLLDAASIEQKRKTALTQPLAGPLLLFAHPSSRKDDDILDLIGADDESFNVLTMLNLQRARTETSQNAAAAAAAAISELAIGAAERSRSRSPNLDGGGSVSMSMRTVHTNEEELELLSELTSHMRGRVSSLGALDDSRHVPQGRTRSSSVGPIAAMDIDLVSPHQVSENRFYARTTTNLFAVDEELRTFGFREQSVDDDDDDEDEDEDEDDDDDDDEDESRSEHRYKQESLTFTPLSGASWAMENPLEVVNFASLENSDGGADESKLNEANAQVEEEESYNIIGQEKVNFDPLRDEAIYDPATNVLVWSNGTKWIRKDFQVFCGRWRDPHGDSVVVNDDGIINYVKPKLGVFHARVIGFYKIAVNVHSNTYEAVLIDINHLRWDNGTIW